MGRGDKRSAKGKRTAGSFGNARPKKDRNVKAIKALAGK
jgi:ribosomal small subunit protein bTHX